MGTVVAERVTTPSDCGITRNGPTQPRMVSPPGPFVSLTYPTNASNAQTTATPEGLGDSVHPSATSPSVTSPMAS